MQTHLLHIINDNYTNDNWKTNSNLAKELLQQRQMILPLLKNISYESLLKEFNNDRIKVKVFIAFINYEYKKVQKILDKKYYKQLN